MTDTPSSFDLFSAKLAIVAELYNKELSAAQQVLYWDCVSDLPLDALLQALFFLAGTGEFFPKPVDIRKAVLGDAEEATEAAWLSYKAEAHRIGAYETPVFEDGALGETIRAVFGGWPEACFIELSPEMWASKRKEFGRVHAVFMKRGSSTTPCRLAGVIEQDRQLRGYDMDAGLVHVIPATRPTRPSLTAGSRELLP